MSNKSRVIQLKIIKMQEEDKDSANFVPYYPVVGEPRPIKRSRDYFMIQGNEIVPKEIDWTKLRPYHRASLKKYRYFTRWKKKYYVHYSMIDDEEKLASMIFTLYGYGKFNVCMADIHIKSKRYNPDFICTKFVRGRCRYKKRGKCNRDTGFKVGMSCKLNKRVTRGVSKRAIVEITPATERGLDFKYRFDKDSIRMGSYPFWKGNTGLRHRKMIETEVIIPETHDKIEDFKIID